MKLLRFFYNLLFPIVLLIMLPGAILRMVRRGNYAHKFGQRFGKFSRRTRAVLRREQGKWIWIHAVSVGEVNIALKFIRELQRDQEIPVLLSTTTSTGFALASKKRNNLLEVIYHPVDFFFTVRATVRMIRPRALVLVEAEIWPNLVREARKCGAPVLLLNARLSERSGRRYQKFRWLVAPLFGELDIACVQNEKDAARFAEIGVHPDKIHITGSVKFDPRGAPLPNPEPCKALLEQLQISPDRKILLGASTHPGEERALLRVYKALRATRPELFLILVPRHAERAREVCEEIVEEGLVGVRSSREASPMPEPPPEVLLVDTTGELPLWTQLASVVFVGKSLCASGGQNPAEAIRAGRPVVCGPNMQNFSGLVELLLSVDGLRQADNEEALERIIAQYLDHPELATAAATRANASLEPHRGATRRSKELLLNLFPANYPPS